MWQGLEGLLWPGFMSHAIAKSEGEENNIAFVMEVTASKDGSRAHAISKREGEEKDIAFVMEVKSRKDGSRSRFVYRFKQCLASICQRSSINLTVHIFANALGKNESLKVLQEITPYCIIRYRLKFYDVDEVIRKILPSINVIKVSECHLNETCIL